jgi:DNA-binding MarR family transcriptional regulator
LKKHYTKKTIGHLGEAGLIILDTLYHDGPCTVARLSVEIQDLYNDAEKAKRFRDLRRTKEKYNNNKPIKEIPIEHQIRQGLRNITSAVMQSLKISNLVFKIAGMDRNTYWGLHGKHDEHGESLGESLDILEEIIVDEKEYKVLNCLQYKDMSVDQLQVAIGIPRQTVANKVKSLLHKGLIVRKRFGRTFEYSLLGDFEVKGRLD